MFFLLLRFVCEMVLLFFVDHHSSMTREIITAIVSLTEDAIFMPLLRCLDFFEYLIKFCSSELKEPLLTNTAMFKILPSSFAPTETETGTIFSQTSTNESRRSALNILKDNQHYNETSLAESLDLFAFIYLLNPLFIFPYPF